MDDGIFWENELLNADFAFSYLFTKNVEKIII